MSLSRLRLNYSKCENCFRDGNPNTTDLDFSPYLTTNRKWRSLYNMGMDKSQLTNHLNGKEPEAITRTLAMMAYNPSIGRVLEKGGVDRFPDLMVETVPKFYGLVTREHFESVHAGACEDILSSFKTNRGNSLSYGQAQKPLNVFL